MKLEVVAKLELVANDALVTKDALVAKLAVPNKEPVNEVADTVPNTDKLPVIDSLPDILSDPVTEWMSVDRFPIITPVFNTWNSVELPDDTIKEPVTCKLFVNLPEPETSKLNWGVIVFIPTLPAFW